jgi:hypothetical protein
MRKRTALNVFYAVLLMVLLAVVNIIYKKFN